MSEERVVKDDIQRFLERLKYLAERSGAVVRVEGDNYVVSSLALHDEILLSEEREKRRMAGWRVVGHDTFSNEDYDITDANLSQDEAFGIARKKLSEIEREQPTATSGGQGFGGIQDRVFVVSPTGEKTRVMSA